MWEKTKKGIEETPKRSETNPTQSTTYANVAATQSEGSEMGRFNEHLWSDVDKKNKRNHKSSQPRPSNHRADVRQIDYSKPPPVIVNQHTYQPTGPNAQQQSFRYRGKPNRWKRSPV